MTPTRRPASRIVDLRSDNVAAAAPEVLEAIARLAGVPSSPYGLDDETRQLGDVLTRTFERAAVGWPVPTGTAANVAAINLLLPTGGVLFCHEGAHVLLNEELALLQANPAIRIVSLPGAEGRMSPQALATALSASAGPMAVSLTEATEVGTSYSLDALSELAAIANRAGALVHMDGARLAPSCVAIGASPADTVRAARIDSLSLGLTKVGGIGADAVVLFDRPFPADWTKWLRRAGYLNSKMIYQSAQVRALIADGLWLTLAGRAVKAARALHACLAASNAVEEIAPSQSNLLLARFAPRVRATLDTAPVLTRPWCVEPWTRLVTSYATTDDEIAVVAQWLADVAG